MIATEFDDKLQTVLDALGVHAAFTDLEAPIVFLKGPMRPQRVPSRYGLSITRAGISGWDVQMGGDDVRVTMILVVTTITKDVADEGLLEELASEFSGRVIVALSSLTAHATAWQSFLVQTSATRDRTPQEQLHVEEDIQCEMIWHTTI